MSDTPKILAGIYEIENEIGSGGGGVVYLAKHLRLDKPVVLKADKRGLTSNTDKLRREVDALKSLSHTYIPQVYDFFIDDGSVYTVMDYIEGESFDKPLKRGEKFSGPMVVKWLRQLLEAVVYLHSRPPYGILHSDIKPANVMLTPTGDICLIDFNIALALGAEGAVAVGASRGYASPEHYGPESLAEATGRKVATVTEADATQPITGLASTVRTSAPSEADIRTGRTILLDVRSDIYSAGATIYHILSGVRPAAKARDVKPLSAEDFASGLVRIISKAMHPDPDLRYQTAAQMLEDVNNLHKNDPRYRRHMRNRYIAGGILAAMLLTSASSTFIGLRRMEKTQNYLVQAQYSTGAFARGDIEAATEYAVSAIPNKSTLFTPPTVPQAISALTDAIGVYDLADGYKSHKTVDLPSNPLHLAISPGGTFAVAIYAYKAEIIQTETAEIVAILPTVNSALGEVEFLDENTIVYAGENGIVLYDIAGGKALWQGRPATAIAVSADRQTIGAVYRDSGEAVIYDIKGAEKAVISFEGKTQRVAVDDTFANPEDNLLALNHDGTLLAASFADGSLDVFDIAEENVVEVLPASGATHFEGGFSGASLAFSAIGVEGKSVFAAIDLGTMEQTGGFQGENPFWVLADESGVYISSENLLVQINPQTGEQQEIAYTGTDILGFNHGEEDFIVASGDNTLAMYDRQANRLSQYTMAYSPDFLQTSGEFAVVGGRNSPQLRIFKKAGYENANVFTYDPEYLHDETRINKVGDRIMMFSYKGFRLCTMDEAIIHDLEIPDSEYVHDQQYSTISGNLAVIYPNALRIYSGQNGDLIFESTGLKSVFYAPYGISILDQGGTLSLIDIDSAQALQQQAVAGNFAAQCGITVDDTFLDGRELIGADKIGEDYIFAVSDQATGTVYNGKGKELFSFEVNGKSEAFFAGDIAIISPMHGTPRAYRISTGKKIRELEPDSFITYVTDVKDNFICEYVSAEGGRYGLLLDSRCETLARLPGLAHIAERTLLFDYKTGYVRSTHIYEIDELKQLIKEEKGEED